MRKQIVTLFGASSDRANPAYARAAHEFGRLVAEAGWVLRTGAGSGASVMGQAADGALEAGGKVEGVILAKFWKVRHRKLHRLDSVPTFSLRKAGLVKGSSGCVIFPGGIGTIDELGDVLALKQNGFTDMPLVLLNMRGYFDPLLRWFGRAVREEFMREKDLDLLTVARTAREAWNAIRR